MFSFLTMALQWYLSTTIITFQKMLRVESQKKDFSLHLVKVKWRSEGEGRYYNYHTASPSSPLHWLSCRLQFLSQHDRMPAGPPVDHCCDSSTQEFVFLLFQYNMNSRTEMCANLHLQTKKAQILTSNILKHRKWRHTWPTHPDVVIKGNGKWSFVCWLLPEGIADIALPLHYVN